MSEWIPAQSVYVNSTPGYTGFSGTGSNFTAFLLGSPIVPKPNKVTRCAITSAVIPLTYYGINSTNNTINITETNGVTPKTYTATLVPGNYTSTTVVTMLNAILTAASLASGYSLAWDCTFSTDTGLMTFATSTAGYTATINFASSTAQSTLGLPSTGTSTGITSTTTYTAPNICNFIGPTEIHIRCGNFQSNVYETRVQTESIIMAIIPITANEFQTVVYMPAYPKIFGHVSSKIDSMQIYITDQFGNILNLNGFGVSIDFAFYEYNA